MKKRKGNLYPRNPTQPGTMPFTAPETILQGDV